MSLDWNSLISAIIGGLLTIVGTILALRITKIEKRKEECRELLPLFNYLRMKATLLNTNIEADLNVPRAPIATESETMDMVKRLSYAARVLSPEEIGEVISFFEYLRRLEIARANYSDNTNEAYYQKTIFGCALGKAKVLYFEKTNSKSGINEISHKLGCYIDKTLGAN